MTEMAGAEVRCECGKILATRDLTPARLLVTNTLHKQSLSLTTEGLSVRGRCPGCSKLHTLFYAAVTPMAPRPKPRRIIEIIGQLRLF